MFTIKKPLELACSTLILFEAAWTGTCPCLASGSLVSVFTIGSTHVVRRIFTDCNVCARNFNYFYAALFFYLQCLAVSNTLRKPTFSKQNYELSPFWEHFGRVCRRFVHTQELVLCFAWKLSNISKLTCAGASEMEPFVVGKPNSTLMELVTKVSGIPCNKLCVVSVWHPRLCALCVMSQFFAVKCDIRGVGWCTWWFDAIKLP